LRARRLTCLLNLCDRFICRVYAIFPPLPADGKKVLLPYVEYVYVSVRKNHYYLVPNLLLLL
jgi:hypothetical protein